MATSPLYWHSISCVCLMCLNQDARLSLITANNFRAEVKFLNDPS